MKKNLEAQHKELEERRRQFEDERVNWETQQRILEQQKMYVFQTLHLTQCLLLYQVEMENDHFQAYKYNYIYDRMAITKCYTPVWISAFELTLICPPAGLWKRIRRKGRSSKSFCMMSWSCSLANPPDLISVLSSGRLFLQLFWWRPLSCSWTSTKELTFIRLRLRQANPTPIQNIYWILCFW